MAIWLRQYLLSGRRLPITLGVITIAAGMALYALATPSPHGYIELLVAIPMIMVGTFSTGAGLLFVSKRRIIKAIGWIIMAGALSPAFVVLFFALRAVFARDV